jgi:hypothetical protein
LIAVLSCARSFTKKNPAAFGRPFHLAREIAPDRLFLDVALAQQVLRQIG